MRRALPHPRQDRLPLPTKLLKTSWHLRRPTL